MSAEDRVTEALQALAGTAAMPVDGEHRLAARLRREHRRRRVVAVVSSVVVVVGIASLAGTLGGGSVGSTPLPFASAVTTAEPVPSEFAQQQAEKDAAAQSHPERSPVSYPPPSADVGGPTWFLSVQRPRYAYADARTGEPVGPGVGPSGFVATAITGAGDGRTYYGAATKGMCGEVSVQRLSFGAVAGRQTTSTHDVPAADGIHGQITSMAVSHDGDLLAYAIATKTDPDYPTSCSAYEVRVLDLRTGATRVWTGEDATPSSLSWAPDDRTLLLHVNPCCGDYQPGVSRLDTQAPGRSFLGLPTTPGTEEFRSYVVSTTASSDTEVFAAQELHGEGNVGDRVSVRIVVLDPVTGRVVRRVATIEDVDSVRSLSVTDDGRHVLLSAVGFQTSGNYRVDDGIVSQLPTHLEQIAW